MNIIQILGIALVATLLSVMLKKYRPEFSVGIVVVFGAIFLLYICNSAETVFEGIRNICSSTGVEVIYIEIMFKVIGISYICESISSICKDAGENSVAIKIDIAGKLIILSASLPVFKELINVITKVPL